MNLSDIRLKQAAKNNEPLELTDPIEKTDFMNIRRKVQPAPVTAETVRATAEKERGINNLIQGLVDLLPKPGSDWSLDDRAKWFRLAAGIFDLGYKTGDVKDREISISLVAAHETAKEEPAVPKNGQLT
jgi:hypothetical protein